MASRNDSGLGWARSARLVALAAVVCLGVGASTAAAATFTWSGAAPQGSPQFSDKANWSGGIPPNSANGPVTLDFPVLTAPVCTSAPPTGTCTSATDDVPSLSATGITIAASVSYFVDADAANDALTIGNGGLSDTLPAGTVALSQALFPPLTLSAAQTWTIDGNLTLDGTVSGATDALGVSLSAATSQLHLNAAADVGPLTITGVSSVPGSGGVVQINGSGLNAVTGKLVTVHNVELAATRGTSVGPLTLTGGDLSIGQINDSSSNTVLTSVGAVKFDSASTLGLYLSPGFNGSLSTGSTVNLGGAALDLMGAGGDGTCPPLQYGIVETLVSATGGITGTFAGVPNGTVVSVPGASGSSCSGTTVAQAIIHYTATTVTATIESPTVPLNTRAPTITGSDVVGQTLTAGDGTWTNNPTGFSYQWQDCNAAGAGCTNIGGATAKTYKLVAGDVSHTIRVVVSATGGVAPATSAATAQVAPPTTFTWTGAAPASGGAPALDWSNATNWSLGIAPTGSVSALVFPALTGANCTMSPPSDACYTSVDNVAGLTTGTLSITAAADWVFSGDSASDPLTIGSGGLNVAPGSGAIAGFGMPITLGASQTWTVGSGSGPVELVLGGAVSAAVTDSLNVTLAGSSSVLFSAPVNVGPVTLTGSGAAGPVVGGLVTIQSSLNGTSHASVAVDAATLFSDGAAAVGPLTTTGGSIIVGPAPTSGGLLTVEGAAALDSKSLLSLVAGSQLTATGNVNLGGATLLLAVASTTGTCSTPAPGTVQTIVSSGGALTGTFAGIPNGGTVNVVSGCTSLVLSTATIHYTANAVTATFNAPAAPPISPNQSTTTTSTTAASTAAPPTTTTTTTTSSTSTSTSTKLPPPVLFTSANVAPVSGKVYIALPAGASLARAAVATESKTPSPTPTPTLKGLHFVPLTSARQIPVGSVLDTTQGTVSVATASSTKGQESTADFSAGIFQLLQDRRAKGVTDLDLRDTLTRRTACATIGKGARATAARKVSNKVLGLLKSTDHGQFSTRGSYSAATVRGTQYSVADTCAGTLTTVVRGVVAVDYFHRHDQMVVLRAGQSFLAKVSGGPSSVVTLGKHPATPKKATRRSASNAVADLRVVVREWFGL